MSKSNVANDDNYVNKATQSKKESCFYRSKHDRQNPYVQISREMFQDRSISPKAKGVLGYLLSLPDDWKVYHKQLMYALNIGEEYLNSAINELIKSGYIRRHRPKIKGLFQPYQYEISEFKISLPDGVFQPGSSSPENPVLQKKKTLTESIEKKQQQPAAPVAVFSCMNDLDESVKDCDKIRICKKYTEQEVQQAIAAAKQAKPDVTFLKTLNAALLQKWVPSKNAKEDPESNRRYAEQVEAAINPKDKKKWSVEVLSSVVEIVYHGSQKQPFVLSYSEKDFRTKFDSEIQRLRK